MARRSLKKRSLTNLKKLLKETERKTESLLKMVRKLEGVKVVKRKAPKTSKRRKNAPKRRTAKRTRRTTKRGSYAKHARRNALGQLLPASKSRKHAAKKAPKGRRVAKGGKGRKASKKGGSPSAAVRQEKKIVQATRQLEKAAKKVEKAVKAPKSKKTKETGKSLLSGLLKQTPRREVFIPEDDFAEIVERGGGLTDE
jgi:hypothetical protein